jgi:hypothetical protein
MFIKELTELVEEAVMLVILVLMLNFYLLNIIDKFILGHHFHKVLILLIL